MLRIGLSLRGLVVQEFRRAEASGWSGSASSSARWPCSPSSAAASSSSLSCMLVDYTTDDDLDVTPDSCLGGEAAIREAVRVAAGDPRADISSAIVRATSASSLPKRGGGSRTPRELATRKRWTATLTALDASK